MQMVTLVTTFKLLLNSIKEFGGCLILLMKESELFKEEGTDVILDQVKELLKLFPQVMPKELHKGLPPLRNTQHQIDSIQGAILPNLPPY